MVIPFQQSNNLLKSRWSVSGHLIADSENKTPCNGSRSLCNGNSSAVTSAKNWQIERAAILLRLCRLIETESLKGKPVLKLARRYSRRWDARQFKCDPTKKLQLSAATLRRMFYAWKKSKSPAVFALRYADNAKRRIPAAFIMEVFRRAQIISLFSVGAIVRSIETDWQQGKRIAGLGTCRAWAKQRGIDAKKPLPLPHRKSLHRYLSGIHFKKRKTILEKICWLQGEMSAIDAALVRRSKQILRRDEK